MNIELYDYAMKIDYGLMKTEKRIFDILTSFPLKNGVDFIFCFAPENFRRRETFLYMEVNKRCFFTPFQNVFDEEFSLTRVPAVSMEARMRKFCDSVNFSYRDLPSLFAEIHAHRLYMSDVPEELLPLFLKPVVLDKKKKYISLLEDYFSKK